MSKVEKVEGENDHVEFNTKILRISINALFTSDVVMKNGDPKKSYEVKTRSAKLASLSYR